MKLKKIEIVVVGCVESFCCSLEIKKSNFVYCRARVFNAVNDFGENTINPYLGNQWPMKWPLHIEALRSIQITDLDPDQVYMLNEMKVGADFAWSVCLQLSDWNVIGDKEQVIIQQLNHYLVMAGLAVALLDQGGREDAS